MENKKNIIIVVLIGLLIIAIGFITYDKLLKNNDVEKRECECSDCKKSSGLDNKIIDDEFDEEERKLKTCKIDMNGKIEIDKKQINQICGDNFFYNFYREVIISNIKIKNETMNVKYLFEGLYSNPDDRIVKIYVDDTLFEIHKGIYSNALSSIKIKGDLLVLTEYSNTEVPEMEKIYNISGESSNKDAIGWDY